MSVAMNKFLTLIIALCSFLLINAQSIRGKISVTIVNDQQAVLENATVELRKAKDSSLVKVAITDKKGLAEFENIVFGNYFLKVSQASRVTQLSSSFNLTADQYQIALPKI